MNELRRFEGSIRWKTSLNGCNLCPVPTKLVLSEGENASEDVANIPARYNDESAQVALINVS